MCFFHFFFPEPVYYPTRTVGGLLFSSHRINTFQSAALQREIKQGRKKMAGTHTFLPQIVCSIMNCMKKGKQLVVITCPCWANGQICSARPISLNTDQQKKHTLQHHGWGNSNRNIHNSIFHFFCGLFFVCVCACTKFIPESFKGPPLFRGVQLEQ